MLYNVFIWFLDQENIGLDPQIMILHEVISEILKISDFEAAILKNDRNWGGVGDAWGPPLAHGLDVLPVSLIIKKYQCWDSQQFQLCIFQRKMGQHWFN